MKDNFDAMSQMTYDQKREYEEQAKMNRCPLEAFKRIKRHCLKDKKQQTYYCDKELEVIETAFKALEILSKYVSVGKTLGGDYCIEVDDSDFWRKEEYELLKEVLL